jgi:hypothetical protein
MMKASPAAGVLPPRLSNGHTGPGVVGDLGGGAPMVSPLSALGEVALVREVLCACQGFDGRHVRYNVAAARGAGGFDVAPEAGVPPVQRHLMLKLCELGWLFRWGPALVCFGLGSSATLSHPSACLVQSRSS